MTEPSSEEIEIQNRIRVELSSDHCRMFRQNVGMGWVGRPRKQRNGNLIIENPRPLHAGLVRGSSDLIGWTTICVTPDMVGQQLAVFTAIEVKDSGDASDEQKNFLLRVRHAGGYAGVARSVEEARAIIGKSTE